MLNTMYKEKNHMINKGKNKEIKRLSKSQRTHIRRLKAEAKKEGQIYQPTI